MKKLFLVGLLAVAAANATITPFLVYPQGGTEVTAPPACTAVGDGLPIRLQRSNRSWISSYGR